MDSKHADLQRIVNRQKSISGPGVFNDGHSIRVEPPRPHVRREGGDLWDWIRLTGFSTGSAIYTARHQLVTPGSNEDPTVIFNAASFFRDWSGSDDCYFRNLDESNFPSGCHFLRADGTLYLLARRSAFPSTDSRPMPFYELNAGAGPVAVTLSSPAGSAGSNGPPPSAAAYTYTVQLAGTTQTIGTSIAVWPARQLGHVTAATKGYADVISGTLYIVQHDEVLDTASCG
jgi:hypothetical protein